MLGSFLVFEHPAYLNRNWRSWCVCKQTKYFNTSKTRND